MSANNEHAEVAIICRVRIGSIATTNSNFGENREMTCVMLNGDSRIKQNVIPEETNSNHGTTLDTSQRSANSFSLDTNEISQTDKNSGPKLIFKPVPRPPSRAKTSIISPNEEEKLYNHVDHTSALPLYNGIPTKPHQRPQSPVRLDMQTSHRLRRVQTPFPSSVRAAAMFAVKKGTVAKTVDHADDSEQAYGISLDHVQVVHLKPSPGYDPLINTQLICITTIDGVFLQISFHYQREQDLLFGFLQAFLLPSIIMIEAHTLRSTNSSLSRIDSATTIDMDKFEAREIHCRSLNESYWEKLKRRTSHMLNCTEEICPGSDSEKIYTCESCSEKGNNTVLTEMEIDDGCSLNRDLSDICEHIHSEHGYSDQELDTSHVAVSCTPNRKDGCATTRVQRAVVDAIDDRDDAI